MHRAVTFSFAAPAAGAVTPATTPAAGSPTPVFTADELAVIGELEALDATVDTATKQLKQELAAAEKKYSDTVAPLMTQVRARSARRAARRVRVSFCRVDCAKILLFG